MKSQFLTKKILVLDTLITKLKNQTKPRKQCSARAWIFSIILVDPLFLEQKKQKRIGTESKTNRMDTQISIIQLIYLEILTLFRFKIII